MFCNINIFENLNKLLNTLCIRLKLINTLCIRLKLINTLCIRLKLINTLCIRLKLINTLCIRLKLINTLCIRLKLINTLCIRLKWIEDCQDQEQRPRQEDFTKPIPNIMTSMFDHLVSRMQEVLEGPGVQQEVPCQDRSSCPTLHSLHTNLQQQLLLSCHLPNCHLCLHQVLLLLDHQVSITFITFNSFTEIPLVLFMYSVLSLSTKIN